MGSEGAQALAKALEYNSSLTSLVLGTNSIGDPGAQALAKALDHNSSLKWLDLSWNSIGDEGKEALKVHGNRVRL